MASTDGADQSEPRAFVRAASATPAWTAGFAGGRSDHQRATGPNIGGFTLTEVRTVTHSVVGIDTVAARRLVVNNPVSEGETWQFTLTGGVVDERQHLGPDRQQHRPTTARVVISVPSWSQDADFSAQRHLRRPCRVRHLVVCGAQCHRYGLCHHGELTITITAPAIAGHATIGGGMWRWTGRCGSPRPSATRRTTTAAAMSGPSSWAVRHRRPTMWSAPRRRPRCWSSCASNSDAPVQPERPRWWSTAPWRPTRPACHRGHRGHDGSLVEIGDFSFTRKAPYTSKCHRRPSAGPFYAVVAVEHCRRRWARCRAARCSRSSSAASSTSMWCRPTCWRVQLRRRAQPGHRGRRPGCRDRRQPALQGPQDRGVRARHPGS